MSYENKFHFKSEEINLHKSPEDATIWDDLFKRYVFSVHWISIWKKQLQTPSSMSLHMTEIRNVINFYCANESEIHALKK